MTIQDQLAAELGRLNGFNGPGTSVASAVGPDGMTVDVELAAVDQFGCLVREVRAGAPKLTGASFDVLKTWGDALSRRLSYLLDATPPFAAGAGWDYSDTNYIVLGMVCERITGTSLYDEVQRRFLTPLKLARVVPSTSRRIPGLIAG